MDVRTFEAVVGADGKVHVLDRHGEHLLFVVLVLDKDVHALDGIGKVYEQPDVVLHDLRRERHDLFRGEGAVRPDFHDELVVVDILPDARVFHVVVDFFDGRINGIDGDVADGLVLVRTRAAVAPAPADGHVHVQLCALVKGADVLRLVDDLDLGILFEVAAGHDRGAFFDDVDRLFIVLVGGSGLDGERLQIEDDLGNVLFDAGDGGKLMLDEPVGVEADALHRRPGERGKQDPAQAVADREAEALFKRFYGDLGVTFRLVLLHFDLGHIHFDHRFYLLVALCRGLLGVQLDDHVLGDLAVDVFPLRERKDFAFQLFGVELQPLGHVADLHRLDLLEIFILFPVFLDGDHVARLDDVRRDVDRSAVDGEVRVVDQLPCLRAGAAHAHAVDHVVQPALEKGEHVFARDALHAVSHFVIFAELPFLHAVDTLGLLLFAQLQAVFGHLFPARAVHAGGRGTLFKRAFGRIAPVALEEQLCAFPAAEAAFGISVRSHMTFLSLITYTLRRLGGLHPLCGMGETSVIIVISRSAAASARIADSLPAPGPLTYTSTVRRPCSFAAFAAVSAAICAANGVPLREPLNPRLPAEDQEIALPFMSVMVTSVLLNEDWICAWPLSTFFSSLRLRTGAPFLVAAIFAYPSDYFFFFATVRRGPLRVRALRLELCPRTGSPFL